MIMDAGALKSLVRESVIRDVDHRDLNRDVPWLEGKIPTVECLVDSIWEILEPAIERNGTARLERLKLWETSTIFAERGRDENTR